MRTLETEVEIGADGSLKLLSPLPAWIKPGRVHMLLTLTPAEDLPETDGGIEKTPGVNGGDACIAGTRIPVWVLEEMRRQGSTEADLLADFPGLTRDKLQQAWTYTKQNEEEIDAALNAHAQA